jgi:monofunctional glycosyltransferase
MKKWLLRFVLLFCLTLAGLFAYGAKGYYDAGAAAPMLREWTKQLVADGLGSERLSKTNRHILLTVEDPSFANNNGTDFSSPGAGVTTITQSLSKRLAFTKFKPGLGKIRQTGYAIGLAQSLRKEEVLTLFLTETSFRGSDGEWTKGFDNTSRRFFGTPLENLDSDRFTLMVASGISPADMAPDVPNAKLLERVTRIKKLVTGECKPSSHNDVWLEGCKFRQ